MTDPDVPFQRDSAEVFSSPHHRGRDDDYQRLLRGEIEADEYVRRLRARVGLNRASVYPLRAKTPREAERLGFWAGVRSIFRW